MPLSDIIETDKELVNKTERALDELFPIEGNKKRLELDETEITGDVPNNDIKKQQEAKDNESTFSKSIRGNLKLVDKDSGDVIDQKRKKIGDLPHYTERGTFIVNGTEYSVPTLMTLKPGVFTKPKGAGSIASQFNIKQGTGRNFNIEMKPGKDIFKFKTSYPNRTFDAYPVLKAMGISDDELKDRWGEEILRKNKEKSDEKRTLEGLYKAYEDEEPSDLQTAKEGIRKNITEGEIDPEVVRQTLDLDKDTPDKDVLARATEKILEVSRGDKTPDDRDSIMFKEPNRPSDSLLNRLTDYEVQNKVNRKVKNNLDRKDDIHDIFRTGIIGDEIERFFTNSQLASVPEQTNPIEFIKNTDKVTVLGEGGLQDVQNVPMEARELNTAQMGFLDPIVTPESDKTGLVEHISYGASIDGNRLKTEMYDRSDGETKTIEPKEMFSSVVSFPDQFKNKDPSGSAKDDKVKAMQDGKMKMIDASEVDYVFPKSSNMFSLSSQLIPFLPTDQGNRTQMATKMLNQSVPLSDPDAPLVQTKFDDEKTVEDELGEDFITKAKNSGTIEKIDRENQRIVVKTDEGEKKVHAFYKNFPLNRESFLDSQIKVSEGDKVSPGDVLADMNFTDDGTLALGKNLKTAYVPYKGLNFEDGVVISEQASEKLKSDRLKTIEIPKGDDVRLGRQDFESHFQGEVPKEKWEKMDEDRGIVQEGETIEQGEPVAAFLKERTITPEEAALGQFHKVLAEPWRKEVKEWDEPTKGEVVDVVDKPDRYEVRVKTQSPARIGDKLANRHGNKGVISKVIPDSEMPEDEQGDTIDVLLNPHGVVSRINAGQLFENAAGKLAKQKGEPYVAENFEGPENFRKQVQKELDEAGISDKERVFDPKHGEIGEEGKRDVNVGEQYMLKLDHRAKDKFSARAYDDPYSINLTPVSGKKVGGQNIGPLVFNSLLSHGARKNLHEMSTYKASRNPEFWRAVETGDALPSPEPSHPWKKFSNMLSAAGINVRKVGDSLKLTPFTDETVENVSRGEIENAREVQAKGSEVQPEEGGLYDPDVTGGLKGDRWGHIELPEEIPHPIFENPIKEITGLDDGEYKRILRGEAAVGNDGTIYDKEMEKSSQVYAEKKQADYPARHGETGGAGIKKLMDQIDIDNKINELEEAAKTQTGSDLNKSHRKLRYLKALKEMDSGAESYFTSKLPVIPPKFRPLIPRDDGQLIQSDLNKHYKDVILSKDELERAKEVGQPEEQQGEMRESLYDKIKGLAGLSDNTRSDDRDYKGAIEEIKGETPKSGFFQGKVLSQRQEQSGRAVTVPDPDLNVDEVGMPKKMGFRLFRPKIIRNLVRQGYSPLEARKKVDEEDERAKKALEQTVQDEVVLMNRAPSLHKFSIQSFTPKIQEQEDDYTVSVPGLIHAGYNMDHDGDAVSLHVPITEEAKDEAKDFLPSQNLYNPANNKLIQEISHEGLTGLSMLSEGAE